MQEPEHLGLIYLCVKMMRLHSCTLTVKVRI